MAYAAIATQILDAVQARMVEFGKTFQPSVQVKVRRSSELNPRYNPIADDKLPLIVITMNDSEKVTEATGLKVFVDRTVTVEWMQTEQPQQREEDAKLRLIIERIRRTLHIIQIGKVVDMTGRHVMNDVSVRMGKPYDLPFEDKKVNVSPQIFTYQTMEPRNNTPGV